MTSFRQIEEKHVNGEVSFMQWSPTMDLIALALCQGGVVLHRLSKKKVWLLPSFVDGDKEQEVTALAWRPDGKILAVSYNSGHVSLCDVENGNVIHSYDLESCINCMSWTATTSISNSNDSIFTEKSHLFLPKLPTLSSSFSVLSKASDENALDVTKINDQENLNVLVIGTSTGFVHLFSFGIFPSGKVAPSLVCPENEEDSISITLAVLSEDLNALTVLIKRKNGDDYIHELKSLRMILLPQRTQELKIVALKFSVVSALMHYLNNTISSICEAWEDIFLEIDGKLTNFAQQKHENASGTVGDDFLELLIFGTASVELERFLIQDLSEKGLKKLGRSIELSYSNIQKLVLKHLQNVGQALVYHLIDIKGMALWYDQFGVLGLTSESVESAIRYAGAFMMKATEIQQVIDGSMKSFKAFFRWLFSVILRLCDEPVPPEFNKATQQESNFVAEFIIENFTVEWDPSKKCNFHLERVGQYLKRENLLFPPATENNPWVKFLNANPQIKESGMLFPHDISKSLIQQHDDLQKAIDAALTKPAETLGALVELQTTIPLIKSESKQCLKKAHKFVCSNKCMYMAFVSKPLPSEKFFFIRQDTANDQLFAVKVVFGKIIDPDISDNSYKIVDFQFYNDDIMSFLLLEEASDSVPILLQLPLSIIDDEATQIYSSKLPNFYLENCIRIVDLGSKISAHSHRRLDNWNVSSFSVSGSRKVSCVLSSSLRRIRLFEMDAEDDDEDDNNASKDSTADNTANTTIISAMADNTANMTANSSVAE